MDPTHLDAIKPLISESSAIIIFISTVIVITFLPQFDKFHSHQSVFPSYSALFTIHFQYVCRNLYLMPQT